MDKEKGSCGTGNTGSCGTPPAGGSCSTEKKGCCGKILMGAIIGGIVMFAWMAASWMALPWHAKQYAGFKDEKAVASAVSKNAPASGVYMVPFTNMGKDKPKTDKPYVFAVVQTDGLGDMKAAMNKSMGFDFLLSVVLAGLLACLLKKTAGCGCPVAMSMKVGLIAGLAAYVPNYVWFHFPAGITVLGVVDCVVGFTLAGFFISKFALKIPMGKAACGAGSCGTKA